MALKTTPYVKADEQHQLKPAIGSARENSKLFRYLSQCGIQLADQSSNRYTLTYSFYWLIIYNTPFATCYSYRCQMKKLALFASLSLTGCISPEQAIERIVNSEDSTFLSDVCFDIGNGFNSHALQDDYFDALKVNDPINCVYEGVKRKNLTEEDALYHTRDVLQHASQKDFLAKGDLQNVRFELEAVTKKIQERERIAAKEEQRRKEQSRQEKLRKAERLSEIAKEMLGDYADNEEGAYIMHLSICLDASFAQNSKIYKRFYENWEQVTRLMDKDTALHFEFKGRDYRKQQMSDVEVDRDAVRLIHWYWFDCETFL
ncbi:hypothetical protein ACVX70_003142 [Vibrio alginolyticus]